jgi:hypothetical protein
MNLESLTYLERKYCWLFVLDKYQKYFFETDILLEELSIFVDVEIKTREIHNI